MSTAWDLLLQHRADLLDQLQSARKKAEAPYLAELESTNRALEALRARRPRGAAAERAAEPQAFAPARPAPRGRQKRSLKDMVQIALRSHGGPMDLDTLTQALEQRWNRVFSQAQVELELTILQQEGAVGTDGDGWLALSPHDAARSQGAAG